jgi:hypothetical protein
VLLGAGFVTTADLGAPKAVAAPSATPTNALTLEAQTPAFVASQSGVNLGIQVKSKLPASALQLEVTLYSHVIYRSTLRETLSGSLPSFLSPLGDPGFIPLSSKGIDWVSGKVVRLHLPVSAPDLPGDAGTGADVGTDGVMLSIDDCESTCGGVYPLQLSLSEEGVGPIASLTTDLIVTPPSEVAGTHVLHFAWVVPLGSSPAISPSGAAELDRTDVGALDTLSSVLRDAPNASLSLEVYPQFVESLEDLSSPGAKSALAELQSLSAPGGSVAILPGPFAPVDVDALVASGMPGAVTAQIRRSHEVLAPELSFQAPEYATDTPIDPTSLGLLEAAGIRRLIVPSTGVQPLSATYAQWTPTAPFIIPDSGVEAIASDPGLEQDLATTVSPALKAQRMLADLSILYFENPEAEQAVAVESAVEPDEAAFLRAMLTGLSQSTVVHAVTLTGLFDSVSPDSSYTSPAQRSLRSPSVAPGELLSSSAVDSAQAALAALGSMQPSSLRSHPPLSDLILESEASAVTASQRVAYLATIQEKANSLSSLVSLPFGRTITVTSLQAKIPISIISNARLPLRAELRVTSPDLGFPRGHTWPVTLYPRTNIVTIDLSARESGDFPLAVTLATRTGFVVQSGEITIRSTAISGVAVGLSIGAALFLVVWWSRSILSKQRRKHKLRGAALAGAAIPSTPDVP